MSLVQRWQFFLDTLKEQGRYRKLSLPHGIDFSSNDYLGYGKKRWPALNPDLSCSGRASRLLPGHHVLWEEVETALAGWHGAETTLVMNSGYTANEGFLSAIIQPEDFLASDQFNHASIIDGAHLARPERFIFRHNDLEHLEQGLRQAALVRPAGRELFIITESLFGMEGDRAPLREMVELAEKYQAHLLADEAHATGCFGPGGSGLVDELGLRSKVLATVHTGGKALGVCGAYVCCSNILREVLVNRCRHLIFTTALPPVIASWWLAMLPEIAGDETVRHTLQRRTRFFRDELTRYGLPAKGEDFIVPIVLGEDRRAVRAAEVLQTAGFDIRAIRPPTVAVGTARLRISIHADHTEEELRSAATCLRLAILGK